VAEVTRSHTILCDNLCGSVGDFYAFKLYTPYFKRRATRWLSGAEATLYKRFIELVNIYFPAGLVFSRNLSANLSMRFMKTGIIL
jgi:hypothetical protein